MTNLPRTLSIIRDMVNGRTLRLKDGSTIRMADDGAILILAAPDGGKCIPILTDMTIKQFDELLTREGIKYTIPEGGR